MMFFRRKKESYTKMLEFEETRIKGYSEEIKEAIYAIERELKEIYKNPENLQPFVFGIPFFKPEKISCWTRFTNMADFLDKVKSNNQ